MSDEPVLHRASFPHRLLHRITTLAIAGLSLSQCICHVFSGNLGDSSRQPNIVLILADDLGFSDIGCYGGEIETPNLDSLAEGGLRFTQFYNTARCWPTRSAIITGYYPQQIGADPKSGNPYPSWALTLPQRLKPLGYRSYHSGKWHLNGTKRALADAGFDHSYRLEDHDRYFYPQKLIEDDQPLPPTARDAGYYTTTAIVDHAIKYLQEHAEQHADEPFFGYLCFNAPHFPLHALAEDIAKYETRYLEGWEVIREARWKRLREMGVVNCELAPLETGFTPRYFKPEVMQTLGLGEIEHPLHWDDLTSEQKRFQARKMAIHAAMVDRMDQEIGRVVEQLRAMNALDNTLIFFLSDNGADATIMVRGDGHDAAAPPGSAESFLCLGPGWASSCNAPFRRHKVWVSEGGISTPLIVHWSAGIAAHGELRQNMGHVIDFVPTILELAGGGATSPPAEEGAPTLPGRNLAPVFTQDNSVPRDFLFFQHEGNRALREDNWKLVSAREDDNVWQLFDLSTDRCERVDLAAEHPDRVAAMAARWQQLEAQYRAQAGDSQGDTP